MKLLKTKVGIIMVFLAFNLNAQKAANQTGLMNSTVTHTFGYEKDGVERPYSVTIRERRVSTAKFDKEDTGKIDQDRIPTPENVAILIGIKNPSDSLDNRVISLRYKKNINDSFDIQPNAKGFIVSVNERKVEYILGEGLHFPDPSDKEFFDIDEFDTTD